MVVFEIDVKGTKRNLYMDNTLHHQVTTNLIPNINKKDKDGVYVIDGEEGSGKSVFAMQLAKSIDKDFCIERVCMTADEFTKAILRATKGQCVVYDEAFTGLSSRGALSEVNKLLVSLMMEMRQKNLFVIIVMPTYFLLDKYVAIWRAKGLFHIYTKKGKRGFWMYFNRNKKKILYLIGKKLYDYSKPKSQFKGRFYDVYTVDEQEYRVKKKGALEKKTRVTRLEKYYQQRNTLLWAWHKENNITPTNLAKLCKKYGFEIERRSITDILIAKKKETLQEEVDSEKIEHSDGGSELEALNSS